MFYKLLTTPTIELSLVFSPVSLRAAKTKTSRGLKGSEIPRESGERKGHCGELVTVHTARLERSPPETQSRSPLPHSWGECGSKLFNCYGGAGVVLMSPGSGVHITC